MRIAFESEPQERVIFREGDLVMTRKPAFRHWEEKLHKKRYLMFKVQKVTQGLKASSTQEPFAIVWFEGGYPPLFQKDLLLVKRDGEIRSDISITRPFLCQ